MPWSTWTTRSPVLRSRKSERNVRVADRRRSCVLPVFLEDVGLGPELEAGFRQPEPARQVAHADEHGCGPDVLGFLDRRGEDLVVREQLDGALGEPGRVRDEDDRVAGLSPAPDLRGPFGHAAGELRARADTRCAVASSSASVSRAVAPSSHLAASSHGTTNSAGGAARLPFATASS